MLKHVIGGAIGGVTLAVAVASGVAVAQPGPFNWDRDFPRIFGRQNNPNLNCGVVRRIDRRGDIVFLQLTCRR